MFESAALLLKLAPHHYLDVCHSGYTWKAIFKWTLPANQQDILRLQGSFDDRLPRDYTRFLSEVSNGAILFYDDKFGQWGFKLYSVNELLEKQNQWHKIIPDDLESRFIVFCELFGEANAMVFDINHQTSDGFSYAVLEANALDKSSDWLIASRSFHEWLDHLITAQGDKYWTWK